MSETFTAEIRVTEERIAQGVHDNCTACPIALSINAALPDYRASVCMEHAYLLHPTVREPLYYAFLPEAASYFIPSFDSGHEVKPFDFKLEFRRLR